MPRRLLRDGRVAVDEWRYLDDAADAGESNRDALIIPFERWLRERESWSRCEGRLGVLLGPAQAVLDLVADLPRLSLIAVQFPSPGEGRGYSHARQLRERWNFTGELRAVGCVRRDQLFFLARCGFTAFELPEAEIESASAALTTFSAEYQVSNDAGLTGTLRHR
ncbi:MAG: DUF934 domain-containing protein [Steroidobacteraceae bacterium]|jgi:uncharacterized protein (DUF934 family)